mgnify:CR=1 FL=1
MTEKKYCIFHVPNHIDENAKSGSHVRPRKMLEAFERIVQLQPYFVSPVFFTLITFKSEQFKTYGIYFFSIFPLNFTFSCFFSHVEYNKMSKKNPVIQILYQLEKWIYKKADRIIFTMPGGQEYIRDRGWDRIINLDKVYHLNNGVDIEEFEHNKMIYKLEAFFQIVMQKKRQKDLGKMYR